MVALLLSLFLGSFIHYSPVDEPAARPNEPTIPFGGTDFKQYYTTSRLILEGHNPYDYTQAGLIQRALGEKGEIQVPYGPPTSLFPFIPMGWLDFLTAIQVQFVVNVSMIVVSCFLWGKMLFPDKPLMPLISTVAVVAWIPCLSLFGMGHVTSWTLFGFTLWCFLMQQQRPFGAGCALAMSIIKPHLAFGLVIYALAVGLWKRQRGMLMGFLLTVMAMVLATFLIRPSIWQEYLGSLEQSNPTQWFNATLDGWGRYYLGPGFRIVSGIMGLALLAWIVFVSKTRSADSNTQARQDMLVITLWMAATPYAFSYDYVLLLPAFLLAVGAWFFRTHHLWLVAIVGWIMLDVVYVMKKGQWYEFKYFFIPWGGLAMALLLLLPTPATTAKVQNQQN